ncbi:hypothetical protein VMCG_03891 [Cytospora schulzeri]|uniref:RRM domain-containing protein n=1 Tax=Cytospora schulzeri TaxID=448051 RepID=A0A423WV42_9PEZI|nr:hypothetical protein VMCG_03891 [Valsa malicola]
MAPEPDPPEALDTIVVEGSNSDNPSQDASVADDDSFDYGEDGNTQEQEKPQEEAAGPEIDDYARTFDSPGREQAEVANEGEEAQQQPQEDVSDAPESMKISDHPDALSRQSPIQPVSADSTHSLPTQGSQPTQPANPTQDASAPTETAQEPVPVSQEALPATSSTSPNQPQASVTSPETEKVETDKPEGVALKEEGSNVDPDDVDMNAGGDSDATAIDIQKLVDEITAKAEAEAEAEQEPPKPSAPLQTQPSSSMDVDLPSLPPKPALTQEQSKQTYSPASYHHASLPSAPSFPPTSAGLPAQPPPHANSSAPAVHMPHQPNYNASPSLASYPNAYPPGTAPSQAPGYNAPGLQQTYDEFLADERKHMSEAKWERFPDGSRIFIGNLSQERVSKRDVFELFHRYGRLAQISLKSAYGFVQYHTVDDAQAAMNVLQGAEVKGRKINLEVSKTQKSKKDREHSPERRNRDRGGKVADRYDGRDGRRSRGDDYRPGRSPSPRRGDNRARQDPYSHNRDRGSYDSNKRKRSRSPDPYVRHGQDPYRRRSPSPYGRGRQEPDHLDIPRRYGNEVPDVQILLMQDVHKDFVEWVQRAFWEQGLRVNSMFLNPRFPQDAVIQRQVLEGVHAVVELDMRAQNTAKIPLQVFDRSAGSNVRFDQYQDLEPPIAAQLVLRTKGSVAQQPAYPPPANYAPQPYGAPAHYGAYQQPPIPTQQPPAAAPDLTSLVGQLSQMGNVDNTTLQTILASLQQGPQSHTPAFMPHTPPVVAPGAPNAGVDLNSLISNLAAASANSAPPPTMGAPVMPTYPAGPAYPPNARGPRGPPAAAGSSDPARDVQNIMETLARIRQ